MATLDQPHSHEESISRSKSNSVLNISDEALIKAIRRPKDVRESHAERLLTTLIDYRGTVIDEAVRYLDTLSLPGGLRALYLENIHATRALSRVAPCLPALDLCAAVALAEGKTLEFARPLSVTGLFYYMGISLFDDVIDNDLEPAWTEQFTESQISFASIAMFAGLPAMALSTLLEGHCSDAVISQMRHWLHEATYEMATGQYLDVRMTAREATLEVCDTVNHGKTGSTGELAAKLAALASGAASTRLTGYAEASRKLYVAMQIASDIQDVWCKPISPDLMNGIMTVPIVYALQALPRAERTELEVLLSGANADRSSHQHMRDIITKSGALRHSLQLAENYRRAARALFVRTAPRAEYAQMLLYFCDAAQLAELQ